MNNYHKVENVYWKDNILNITVNGKEYEITDILEKSHRLANATPEERNYFEVIGAGYGIHWRIIDEDLSIDGLLNLKHKYNIIPKKF